MKVLDFGLAKLTDPAGSSAAVSQGFSPATDLSQSPTITSPAATRMGVILGTAAYMSPEQARGKPLDKRADVWAVGCVLYEMLTGRRPFEGEDVSLTLAAVMKSDPDLDALPFGLSPALRTFLRRCLEKDPRQRVRDIGDVRLALEGAFEQPTSGVETPAGPALRPWQQPLPAMLGALALLAIGALAGWTYMLRGTPPPAPVTRFVIHAPDGAALGGLGRGNYVTLSPDGRQVVFIAGGQLYVQSFDQLAATPLPGTNTPYHPFYSPDGRWVGFCEAGELKRVRPSGGTPLTVAQVGDDTYRGATWAPDDAIIFGQLNGGLMRVAASGGVPETLTTLDLEASASPGYSARPDPAPVTRD